MTLREKICDAGVNTLREYICMEHGHGDVFYNGVIVIQEKKGLSLAVEKNIILEEQKVVIHRTTENLILAKKTTILVGKKDLVHGCL